MTTLIPIKTIEETYKGVICSCYHCGERFGANSGQCAIMCKNCRTADQRAKMDAENKEINPNFVCKFCEAMKRKRENEKKS